MSGPVGNDMGFDGKTNQGEVSYNIQEFMSGRLIGEAQLKVVQIAFAFYFNFIFFEDAGESAHFFFSNWLVYYNNGVVDVSTFDEVVGQQGFQLMEETKCSAGCNFSVEVLNTF